MASDTPEATPDLIRKLEPRDRAAVREICCRTAFRNAGSDKFFEDREVHADYWTSYYTDYHPQESWVIERGDEVIGYFFGASDYDHFFRTMSRKIVPKAVAKALWRLALGRYKQPQTKAYLKHMIFRGAAEAPHVDFKTYPAQYHCNILRKGYGRGYYTQLVLMYLDHLDAIGVSGIHGMITEPAGGAGIWHKFEEMFIGQFEPDGRPAFSMTEKPTTLFKAVTGNDRPMVNRAWSVPVANFRRWIMWVRETQKI